MDLKNDRNPMPPSALSLAARHLISAGNSSSQSHAWNEARDPSQRRRFLISILDEALEVTKDAFDDESCNHTDASSSSDSYAPSQ